jgi:class 3 adenylate cyclase
MIVGGPAFTVAEEMAAKAPAGEVWVSRMLVDLVPGSDLEFQETGQSLPLQGREIAMLSLEVES